MYKYAVNIKSVPEIIERGNLIIERIRLRAESEPGGVRRYGILPDFCTPGSVL